MKLTFSPTGPWQGALLVGDRQHQNSILNNLRNFTTEQRGTTVLCVRKLDKVGSACINCDAATSACFACSQSRGIQVVIMADGQVTRGNEIVKPNVTKVRRLNDSVISGFAGGVLKGSCK